MKLTFMNVTSQEMINYLSTTNARIYNFCSMISIGIPVPKLYPYQNIFYYLLQDNNEGDANTIQFDAAYANQVLFDINTFSEFMRIMMDLDKYDEVIVLVNYDNPYIMNTVESLVKLIQERYGIQSYIVNCIDDIDPYAISEFSQEGYMNYINDVDKYKASIPPDIIMREGDADEQYNTNMG